MKRSRTIAWAVVVGSVATTLFGGWTLANRIHQFNLDNPRNEPYFLPVTVPQFAYKDRVVNITNILDDEGKGEIRVEYGDDLAAIPIGVPNTLDLPGLARHSDWLGVFFVGEPEGRKFEEYKAAVDAGEIEPRLIIVSRHLNPGIDDSAFGLEVDASSRERGETMRKRWTFGFLVFEPEGGFSQRELKYPESTRSFEGRSQAAMLAGKPQPVRDPNELQEDTWEWYAALQVIPSGKAPARSFKQSALAQSGWAFPVTAVGILGLILGLGWAVLPSPKARWESTDTTV